MTRISSTSGSGKKSSRSCGTTPKRYTTKRKKVVCLLQWRVRESADVCLGGAARHKKSPVRRDGAWQTRSLNDFSLATPRTPTRSTGTASLRAARRSSIRCTGRPTRSAARTSSRRFAGASPRPTRCTWQEPSPASSWRSARTSSAPARATRHATPARAWASRHGRGRCSGRMGRRPVRIAAAGNVSGDVEDVLGCEAKP